MTTKDISIVQAQELLVKLTRLEIGALERARRLVPTRSPEAVAFDLAHEATTQATFRRAFLLCNWEVGRATLRTVAQLLRLGGFLDDWVALALKVKSVLLVVSAERDRRDQGLSDAPSPLYRCFLDQCAPRPAELLPSAEKDISPGTPPTRGPFRREPSRRPP